MNRILVCLDASPRAALILERAVDLARATRGKLLLFRAVGLPPDLPASALGVSPNTVVDMLVEDAKKWLQDESKVIPADLLDGTYTRVGTPWSAICAAAKDLRADVIVVGSHGYSGLDHLIGTTAAKVVNHADRSVLVVRPTPA